VGEESSSTGTTASAVINIPQDTSYQFGTIDFMARGLITGTATVADIKHVGDTGVGTFDYIDGEMMVLGGRVYRFKVDGTMEEAADGLKSPFANVTTFIPNITANLNSGMDYPALRIAADSNLNDLDLIWAVTVHGTFNTITTRAPPAGTCNPTCPGLLAVLAQQLLFTRTNMTGTMVGFRYPLVYGKPITATAGGPTTDGWHFHFLSDDHTYGGHVINFQTGPNTVMKADDKREYHIMQPGAGKKERNARDDDDDRNVREVP
jgi:acetolactate decarboxylase